DVGGGAVHRGAERRVEAGEGGAPARSRHFESLELDAVELAHLVAQRGVALQAHAPDGGGDARAPLGIRGPAALEPRGAVRGPGTWATPGAPRRRSGARWIPGWWRSRADR